MAAGRATRPSRAQSPQFRTDVQFGQHNDYVEFFNTARPHQGLEQQIPVSQASGQGYGPVRCRTVLGGIIHDYYRDAA